MNTQKTGLLGEEIAQNLLIAKGYLIIKTNYYSKYGEIDIIATKDKQLIFIEVKTRTQTHFGTPEEALTYKKRQRILKTALHFLNSSTKFRYISWRIDIIGIQLDQQRKPTEITHIKNI